MPSTTVSSREFNQHTGRVKKAATKGPVFITDRGKPALVVLTIKEYERITKKQPNIVDLIAMPEGGDIEFDPPRMGDGWLRPADLV